MKRTKSKYQVWGYDSTRNDFTKDFGEHDDLKIAIQVADDHANAIVEAYVVNEDWSVCHLGVIHCSFDSDESEAFFKRKFPNFFFM